MLIFIPFRRGVLMYFPPYFIPLCDKYTIMIFVQCTMYIIRSLALGISIFIHIFVIQQTVNSFTQKPSTPRERERKRVRYIYANAEVAECVKAERRKAHITNTVGDGRTDGWTELNVYPCPHTSSHPHAFPFSFAVAAQTL